MRYKKMNSLIKAFGLLPGSLYRIVIDNRSVPLNSFHIAIISVQA
jgi:hypothetical protein